MTAAYLIDAIDRSPSVFLSGAGRTGLMVRAFGMRLAQMGLRVHVVGETTGDQTLRDFAATADLGISVADAALAETGTVVISTGPGSRAPSRIADSSVN